jgi:LPS sulfotransferase NodH
MSRELENEDEAWRAYLVANGVDMSDLGEAVDASASSTVKNELVTEAE